MRRLRLTIAAVTLTVTLFVGSGVASAGVEWCDWGCPPPIESGKVANPKTEGPASGAANTQMPTPIFKNANLKFEDTLNKTDTGKAILLPPGFATK